MLPLIEAMLETGRLCMKVDDQGMYVELDGKLIKFADKPKYYPNKDLAKMIMVRLGAQLFPAVAVGQMIG